MSRTSVQVRTIRLPNHASTERFAPCKDGRVQPSRKTQATPEVSVRPSSEEALWSGVLLALERAQKQVESLLTEVAEARDLALPEALTLIAAQSLSGVCQQRDLGDRLGWSPGHLSGVVERLRARGLLTAERLPQDRRRQCWRLTDQGQGCVAEIWRDWRSRLGEPSIEAATFDLASLAEHLNQLESRCGELSGPPRLRLADSAGGRCS
jgi:DNA-binding MarR family transcriptional regulator